MSFSIAPSKKRIKTGLFCIFCEECDNTVQQPKPESYKKIQQVAARRKDDAAERFDNSYNPNVNQQHFSWHKNCFATYTSEEKIRRQEVKLIKQKESQCDSNLTNSLDLEDTKTQNVRLKRFSDVDDKKCLICGNFYKNKSNVTFTVSNHDFAEKLLSVARIKMDKIYTKLCTCDSAASVIARKFQYHDICMKNYMFIPKSEDTQGKVGRPLMRPSDEVIHEAFEKVLKEINFNNSAVELSFLTTRVNSYLDDENSPLENKDMKRFLINKYEEKVLFSHPADITKSTIVILIDLPISEFVMHAIAKKNKVNCIPLCGCDADLCENFVK